MDQVLLSCSYSNLTMVYAEVMIGKCVNLTTMTTHSCSQIIRKTIDTPTNVDWDGKLMYYAITKGLLQKPMIPPSQALT